MSNGRIARATFYEDAVEATFVTEEAMNEAMRQMPRQLDPAPGKGARDVVFSFRNLDQQWEPTLLCEVAAALIGAPEEFYYPYADRSGTVAGFVADIDGLEVVDA